VTSDKEEQQLHEVIFRTQRKAGEPLYGFAMDFCTAVSSFNQISWTKVQPSQCVHWMIYALNLSSYPMLELKIKLTLAKERGADSSEILKLITTFPNLTTLTQLEKQLHSARAAPVRSYVVESPLGCTGSESGSDTEGLPAAPEKTIQDYNGRKVLQSFKVTHRANLFP
jgi:hypothetical protein